MIPGSHNPILKTKFQCPDLPDDYIPRKRLIAHVVKNFSLPLTLVSADSGSGKTLFVSRCLQEVSSRFAWVSLDPTDNDLRSFFTYFVTAILQEIPGFGEHSLALLTASHLPPVDELTKVLINDLNSLEEDLLLVVDDLHLISNPDIFRLLTSMLEFPPPRFHLVLISRTDPPLPLERLLARNKLSAVNASHLRLTREEIRMFVEKNLSFPDIEPLVEVLAEKTEGWVTGLRLAMLHLSFRSESLEQSVQILQEINFSGKYFMEEVLGDLDPLMTQFLLKTSILEKFTPSLTDHMLGLSRKKTRSDEILRKIIRMNLFVENLDRTDNWYRYHHLFQEFLQKEMRSRLPEKEIKLLHEKAIDWYEANRFLNEAFYHAQQIDDQERMADMIEEHMDIPLNENKWYILDDWLSKLPESFLYQRAGLLVALMWVMHNKATWVIVDILERLDVMSAEEEFTNDIRVQIRFFKGIIRFWKVEIAESLRDFEYARKNIPKNKKGVATIISFYYLMAAHMNGTGRKAVKEIEKLLLNELLDPFYRAMLTGGIAYVRMLEGNLAEVEELAKKINGINARLRDGFIASWVSQIMGMVCFYQHRLEEAEKHFNSTLDNIYALNLLGPMDSYGGLLLTLGTLKKKEEQDRIMERLQDFVRRRNIPALETFLNSIKTRTALLEGDMDRAVSSMNSVNMFFDSGNLFFWLETPRVTHCKYLLAFHEQEKDQEAGRRIAELINLADRTRNVPQGVQVRVLRAVLKNRVGDNSGAEKVLAEALEMASPGNWIRPFFEGGGEVREVLERLTLSPVQDNFRERILEEFEKYSGDASKVSLPDVQTEKTSAMEEDLASLLTNRELDVLLLLAKRRSNKEIANELFISVATVKRHVVNIYRKLNVNKRREAILKAERAGILPVWGEDRWTKG